MRVYIDAPLYMAHELYRPSLKVATWRWVWVTCGFVFAVLVYFYVY